MENNMKAFHLSISSFALSLAVLLHTPFSTANEVLAQSYGCVECHGSVAAPSTMNVPGFKAIADKYRNEPNARSRLIQVVSNGGKGNWTKLTGGIPMPPFSPRLSESEISSLVDWVLSQ
jgi:cytochrome c